MLSKLIRLGAILCLLSCFNIAYGNNVNKLEDILNKNIPLDDKLEYLDLFEREKFSLSQEDMKVINKIIFGSRYPEKILEGLDENHKPIFSISTENILEGIDIILERIFRILLVCDLDNSVLDQDTIESVMLGLGAFAPTDDQREISSKLYFLSLKVLIKFNILKFNSDTEFFIKLNYSLLSGVPGKKDNLKSRMERAYTEWEFRDMTEDAIFSDILAGNKKPDSSFNIKINPEIYNIELREYESYLLDNLAYFYINDNLKLLVEQAFFTTLHKEFRSRYIDVMFYLDMQDSLLKIIKDESLDSNIRIKTIQTSIKLLDHIERIAFKKFSSLLLKTLENISINSKDKNFKKDVQEKIAEIKLIISNDNEIKYLSNLIFDKNISVKNKLIYLEELKDQNFSFSVEDSEFIVEVLNNENIDFKVQKYICALVVKSKYFDSMKISQDDRDSIEFLAMSYDTSLDNFYKNIISSINEKSLKQFKRFDLWMEVLSMIANSEISDKDRKLAIKTSLELAEKTNNFENFITSFLKKLQNISNNSEESEELRNISDLILITVKKEGVSFLKEGNIPCNWWFLF